MRREIAKFFESEKKFKIRSNDDPIELLFFYINAIHSFNTKAYSVRNICPKKCDPICISHSSIWQELIEEIVISLNISLIIEYIFYSKLGMRMWSQKQTNEIGLSLLYS